MSKTKEEILKDLDNYSERLNEEEFKKFGKAIETIAAISNEYVRKLSARSLAKELDEMGTNAWMIGYNLDQLKKIEEGKTDDGTEV